MNGKNGFPRLKAQPISFLTFLEATAAGVIKTTNAAALFSALAIASGHSLPGSMPSSYHTRSPNERIRSNSLRKSFGG
jgi:hypothetical protein